jgi:hypothetical protein
VTAPVAVSLRDALFYRSLERDELEWILDTSREYGALLFVWHGRYGEQPILMPGDIYHWWSERVELAN